MKKSLCVLMTVCLLGLAGMSFANTTAVVNGSGPAITPPVSEIIPVIPPPPPPPKK